MPALTKSKTAILSIKAIVKSIRSLTLVSFERISLVEYECQIHLYTVSISYGSKVMAVVKGKVFFSRTDQTLDDPELHYGGIKL